MTKSYLLPDGSPIDLGTRVRFDAVLARRYRTENPNNFYSRGLKVWERVPLGELSVVKEGIVVGVRTLADGWNEYNGYDEPIVFHPTERFRAIMIVTDLRSRPVFARFEDVEVLP